MKLKLIGTAVAAAGLLLAAPAVASAESQPAPVGLDGSVEIVHTPWEFAVCQLQIGINQWLEPSVMYLTRPCVLV